MNYLQVLILAVIQGMAELLPVSSSAHVIVAEKLMGLDPSSPEMTFLLVMLHTGTMVAVLFYFWPRWRPILLSSERRQFVKMIILAAACTGVVALGLMILIENVFLVKILHKETGEIEDLFGRLPLIAASLLAAGILILIAGRKETEGKTSQLTPRSCIWIGIVQGFCVPFRGFSRSGATISTGMIQGVSRPLAEDFSFALAVVLTPLAIARLLRRLAHAQESTTNSSLLGMLWPGTIGMAFSFVAGLLALKLLSAALEKGQWKYFGYYCIGAAAVVFTLAICGL
jgi:undecaprenyl-diphosphatase